MKRTLLVLALSAPLFCSAAHAAPINPGVQRSGALSGAAQELAEQALSEFLRGDLASASKKVNAALRMRPERSYLHLLNAMVYHLQANTGGSVSIELAREGYEMAVRLDPNNWMAHFYLGMLQAEFGELDKARRSIAQALFYQPNDPEVLKAFAYVAYRTGSPDLAAGALKNLESQGGLQGDVVMKNAAMVYAALGETDKANGYMKKAAFTPASEGYLSQRIADWQRVYNSVPRSEKVQMPAPNLNGALGQIIMAAMPPPYLTAPGTENKMIVVDVVLIATEEDFSTSAGLNVLRGLNLFYGATRTRTETSNAAGTTVDQTITRALTIPAVLYSLNIANTGNNRNEILSRPTLVAAAGAPADFFSGVDLNAVAFPVGAGAAAVQPINIQREIGVRLSITPSYVDQNLLSLQIYAQRTFIKPPNNDISGFASKLEMSKSSVNTRVVMRFGESLILGGLSEKELVSTRDGVPLLQEIPGLQYLFSNKSTSDKQKSVLILITPRTPQYVYQTDRAREEYEKTLTEDERPLANLKARYSDWFEPYPNWASVFHHLQESSLYLEFRTGDVTLETWSDMRTLGNRMKLLKEFLHY